MSFDTDMVANVAAEQYRALFAKLQIDEQRSAALKDIQNWYSSSAPEEALPVVRNVGISKIIKCLNLSDMSQSDIACDILKMFFNKIDFSDNIVKCYTSHIMYLLRHEKACVRRLAIDEVHKTVTSNNHTLPLPKYLDVYVATAQMVADEDTAVSLRAVTVTSQLPQEAYPKVLDEMMVALEYDASKRTNAYEVIVNISEKSAQLFNLAAEMGYIDTMVSGLQTEESDVLYQLNILQLLSRLAVTPHGLNYLVNKQILQSISDLQRDIHLNPHGSLLKPGYIKFFGNIAHYYPREILGKFPHLWDLTYEAIISGIEGDLIIGLDTLGFVGTTIEGKLCLAAIGSKYTEAVERVGQLIRNSTQSIKVRAIPCLANLIGVDKDPSKPATGPVDHRITLMTREWFRSLDRNPMDVLGTLCKNPFIDLKLEGFGLLDAICQHQWGEELVARTAGFVEYLLDRRMDHCKEIKDVKYDVIKRLASSPAFDETTTGRLQSYVEQGPYYAEAGTAVAMDDE